MQVARLLDARVQGRMYYVEYTVQKPKQSKKHLLSLVALGNNGRHAWLSQPLRLPEVEVLHGCETVSWHRHAGYAWFIQQCKVGV